MNSTALKITHETDPASKIMEAVGDISDYQPHGPRVLLAIYERGDGGEVKTAGGVIIPSVKGGTLDEDQYQGKVCLVLKKGPLAFQDDASNQFHGDDVAVGSWVAIRPTDGWQVKIGNQKCRIVRDSDIQLSVPHADAAF